MRKTLGTHVGGEEHVACDFREVPQGRVIEYLRLEIDRENAFDHGVGRVNAAVAPSKLQVVVQIEDRALFSVFCFPDGGVQVVVERVDETLSSCFACSSQTFSEPVEGRSDVSGMYQRSRNGTRRPTLWPSWRKASRRPRWGPSARS